MEKRVYPESKTSSPTTSCAPGRPLTPQINRIPERASGHHWVNPFDTPFNSRPASIIAASIVASSSGLQQAGNGGGYFRSRRVRKGEVEKPWLSKKDPREKWVTIIPIIGLIVGLVGAGFLVYHGLRSVVNYEYCLVLDEDFSAGLNEKIWTKEAQVGGFGNGQFEETTVTDENVFVRDGILTIKPTLQDANLIDHDSVIDLTKQGICTSNRFIDCVIATNTTNGTIVNPVKSARISTKNGAVIKYGRVEVTARLPEGDWLWPAIWMMPTKETYGIWPQSGEIDLAESRGNDWTYAAGGNNIVSSALHWGPNPENDAWWRTHVKRRAKHTTFAKEFHTFGVEWSESYIFTYINSRLLQVLYTDFNQPLWPRGNFPLSDENGTRFIDPWSQTGRRSTPFDEDFYLILNVAVGGSNGWFEDGKNGKPWVNLSPTARRDFWNARGQWYPTWEKRGSMEVSRVQMWQQKGYNGC